MITLLLSEFLVAPPLVSLTSLTSNSALALKDKGASLVAQLVKNPPTKQETQVQFLGQEDPLEKG